jgi:hypothetical protein
LQVINPFCNAAVARSPVMYVRSSTVLERSRGHRFESGLEVPAYDIGGDDNVGGGDSGEAGQGRDEVGEGGELRLRHRGGTSATGLHIK